MKIEFKRQDHKWNENQAFFDILTSLRTTRQVNLCCLRGMKNVKVYIQNIPGEFNVLQVIEILNQEYPTYFIYVRRNRMVSAIPVWSNNFQLPLPSHVFEIHCQSEGGSSSSMHG